MVKGDFKARALAAVRAFVASLPSSTFGRDEGWEPEREEQRRNTDGGGGGRDGRASASKRHRSSAAGDRGDGQEKEKRPKGSKAAMAREERQREEMESKQRLSQVPREALLRGGVGWGCVVLRPRTIPAPRVLSSGCLESARRGSSAFASRFTACFRGGGFHRRSEAFGDWTRAWCGGQVGILLSCRSWCPPERMVGSFAVWFVPPRPRFPT